MTDLVALIRGYAEERYYYASWDIVATEWSDEQIAEAIEGARTRRGAIAKAWGVLQKIDARRARRTRPVRPISLLEFLAANGGIRADDRMISDLRQTTGGNVFLPPYGWLIREYRPLSTAALIGGAVSPKYLDDARRAAVDAGYLQDTPWEGGVSTSTINDLLDAIDTEYRDGRKIYPHGEPPFEPAEREEQHDAPF